MKLINFIIILVFILFIYFIYNEGKSKGASKEVIVKQEQEIKIADETIKEYKEVTKRKNDNSAVSDTDNLDWLFKEFCQDC